MIPEIVTLIKCFEITLDGIKKNNQVVRMITDIHTVSSLQSES